jgi:SAM-dependent methyltransferase
MSSRDTRYDNTASDLLRLGVKHYCDLGPGAGEIASRLKNAGKEVCVLEAPWDFEARISWTHDLGISGFKGDFFSTNLRGILDGKGIQCFSLIHCIAHLRFPPQLLFEQIYSILPNGGYFYLSTVNAGSLMNVLKLARGGAITDEVEKYRDMGEEYRTYCNPSGRYMIWDSWMHVKEYRDFELRKMFESEGFTVVELRHRNNFSNWKSNLLCRFWPHLSEEIVIVGRKG